jgi:hypothetical protein
MVETQEPAPASLLSAWLSVNGSGELVDTQSLARLVGRVLRILSYNTRQADGGSALTEEGQSSERGESYRGGRGGNTGDRLE